MPATKNKVTYQHGGRHGGRREGAGRKPSPAQRDVAVAIRLNQQDSDKFRALAAIRGKSQAEITEGWIRDEKLTPREKVLLRCFLELCDSDPVRFRAWHREVSEALGGDVAPRDASVRALKGLLKG